VIVLDAVKSFAGGNNMEKYLCLNITEAVAEVQGCKADLALALKHSDRNWLSLAKAALRSAERELRDWQKGIVGAAAGR
jgi:hypothetical protein